MSNTHFTKTETLRRLRAAAALIRANDSQIAPNFRVEVGTRVDKVAFPELFDAVIYDNSSDNDLEDCLDLDHAARLEEVQAHGYIANIYFYSTGDWGELHDVQNVWLGTPEQEPVLFHRTRGMITKEVN